MATTGDIPVAADTGGTQLGKRYADGGGLPELLCTKADAGTASMGWRSRSRTPSRSRLLTNANSSLLAPGCRSGATTWRFAGQRRLMV
jgi:hypothetical protein